MQVYFILEYVVFKHEIKSNEAFSEIDGVLREYQDEINLIGNLLQYKLDCKANKYIEEYQYVFKSIHKRNQSDLPINVYHIVLNYNHLVIS